MELNYKRKYLIVGPWPRNRKIVRDILSKNTNLVVSPRKLRPVQLAHSDVEVAIGDGTMSFNNSQISVKDGENDVNAMRKYNIRLIYVSSYKSRESHILIRAHIKHYKDLVEVTLPEPMFEREGAGAESKLLTIFKDRWNHV